MQGLALRFVAVIGIAVCTVVGSALPASAHGAASSGVSNFHTVVRSVEPAIDGVSVQAKENGDRFQIRNNSSHDVVVLGYQGEPYLRITRNGVWENSKSPAVAINGDRYGSIAPPPDADAKAAPKWHRVSGSNVAVWHDHRAHWMSTTPPPVVVAEPKKTHVVMSNVVVPFLVDGRAARVIADVNWDPPHARTPIFLVMSTFAVILALLYRLGSRTFVLTAFVVIATTADIVHVTGAFIGGAGTWMSRLGAEVTNDAVSVIVWFVAVWCVRLLRRGRIEVAGYLGVFVAAMIVVFGGFTDISTLWASHLVTSWPDSVARTSVGVSIVGGGALLLASLSASLLRDARTWPSDLGERQYEGTAEHQDR